MPVSAKIEVYGIKEAFKELNKLDPILRKQITKDAKEVAKPVVSDAQAKYPPVILSGMKYNWVQKGKQKFPYDQMKARKGITVKIDTSKKNIGTIVITQKDPAAAIIDMAGKKGGTSAQSDRFISALTMMFGMPSRVMWPAYNGNADAVQKNMVELVATVMAAVGRKMV
jgi:hypothetical protein